MIELVSVSGSLLPFNKGNINSTFKALVKPLSGAPAFVAVVKDLPARELFNELFSYLVLRELGLPVPSSYVGFVSATEQAIKVAPINGGGGQKMVFVSQVVPEPSMRMQLEALAPASPSELQFCVDQIVPKISGWDQLGELYAFDLWVANIDRNLGNILLGAGSSTSQPSVWLIDHGMAFTSPSWQAVDLVPEADYRNLLAVWATPRLAPDCKRKCLTSAAEFQRRASGFDKDSNIEYLSQVFGLDKAESDAAKNFLGIRLGQLTQRSEAALGLGSII